MLWPKEFDNEKKFVRLENSPPPYHFFRFWALSFEQFLFFESLFLMTWLWKQFLIRELKQQRRRRLLKRHLKSEVVLLETLSRLFHLVYRVKCWQVFLELNAKGLYQSSGREKEHRCLVFPSSTKREFRHLHVAVVQRRQRNVQKSVMHGQLVVLLIKPIYFIYFFGVLVAVAVVVV